MQNFESTVIELVKNVAGLQVKVETMWTFVIASFLGILGTLVTNFIQISIIKKNGFGYCSPAKKRKR